ncbi:MAG: transporter, partial [Gammaproteobacteria bacterium]|nr:transporter [Gammaproteobacteria bacterium]
MPRLMRNLLRISALLAWLALSGVSFAQDVEPRRWTHLPVGLNVLGAAYVYTDGDIFLDPVLLVDNAETEQHTAVVGYTRSFGLAGRTARLDVLLPIRKARWQGLLDGVFTTVRREGPADPILRLSVNLVGGPALKSKEFREFRAANTT